MSGLRVPKEALSEPLSECHFPLRVAGPVAPNHVALKTPARQTYQKKWPRMETGIELMLPTSSFGNQRSNQWGTSNSGGARSSLLVSSWKFTSKGQRGSSFRFRFVPCPGMLKKKPMSYRSLFGHPGPKFQRSLEISTQKSEQSDCFARGRCSRRGRSEIPHFALNCGRSPLSSERIGEKRRKTQNTKKRRKTKKKKSSDPIYTKPIINLRTSRNNWSELFALQRLVEASPI